MEQVEGGHSTHEDGWDFWKITMNCSGRKFYGGGEDLKERFSRGQLAGRQAGEMVNLGQRLKHGWKSFLAVDHGNRRSTIS